MKRITLLLAAMMIVLISHSQTYWTKIMSNTSKDLLSVSFGNSLVGYIGGKDSLLLKSTDGGQTWAPVNYSGLAFSVIAKDIIHVNFKDADTGFLIVSNFQNPAYTGALYETVNGGLTWTGKGGNIAPYSTYFYDARNGYVVGSAFFAGKTIMQVTNSSWSSAHNLAWLPEDFLYTIDCRNSICIAAGSEGYVYRTMNNGTTWDTIKTVTDSAIYSVKFLDDHTIISATNEPMGGIMVSTDTGKTWQYENNMLTFFYPQMRSVAISKSDSFIVAGKVNSDTTGVILWWNGNTPMYEGTEQEMHSVNMRDDSVAFAVGNKGLILHNKNLQVGINDPEKFTATIYPNPSAGLFTVKTKLLSTFQIYNIEGKLISLGNTLRKQHYIDLSNYSKGIYLLKVSAGQQQSLGKIVVQ